MEYDVLAWAPAVTMIAASLGAAIDRGLWSICIIYAMCGSRCVNWTAWGVCTLIFALAVFVGGINRAAR